MLEANFLKHFSRQEHAEERKKKAEEIIEARKSAREAGVQKPEVEGAHIERSAELESAIARLEKLAKDIEAERENIEKMSSERFGEIRNFFALMKARQELANIEGMQAVETPTVARLRQLVDEHRVQIDDLSKRIEDPAHILETFYEEEKKAWQEAPISEQDIREHFTAEHLAGLSTEEYILLMKRFPNEMVTHVSRRGVRDHTGFLYHSSGVDEFHDSFDRVLESGKLQSALATKLEAGNAERMISQFVQLDNADNRQDAIAMLDAAMERPGFSSVADVAAFHVAAEDVADVYYGAESKNEVFVAHPSALIAAEYMFSGSLTNASEDRSHNDTWIWMKEEEGIPIDAGFVFLPKDTMVDPETGSRYATDAEKKPIVAQELIDELSALAKREDFATFILAAAEERRHDQMLDYDKPKTYSAYDTRQKIKEQFGVTNESLVKKIEEYAGAELVEAMSGKYATNKSPGECVRTTNALIERYLREEHLYFKEAKNSVSAEEFWNAYFVAHPERKPKHIVMYEGGNPAAALEKWRRENGLVKRGKDLGIDLNRGKELQQRPGQSTGEVESGARFRDIVMEAINARFPEDEIIPPDVG